MVMVTINEDGSKKIEIIVSSKSPYLNTLAEVYVTLRDGKPYPVTQEQVITQLEILND